MLVRRGARRLGLALLLACERDAPGDEVAAGSRLDVQPELALEDRYAEPEFVPKRTIRVRAEDTQPIEELEASVESRTFERRAVGEPRELFRAKHLRLGHAEPMTGHAGIVEVLADDTDAPQVLEAHLVDFETGPVAKLSAISGGVYSKFGVAEAEASVDGEATQVLVHADGKMIAWRDAPFASATLYVNPGLGDAWLFVNDGDDAARTSYSHWTDLRSPPPAPSHELPFHFDPGADESGDRIVGPRINEPDAIPAIVTRSDADADCARALLHADGTFGCIPPHYEVMADGWRIDPRLGKGRVANVDTGDLVVLEMGPECGVPADITPDPPRAYYPLCSGLHGDQFVWSPVRTVRWRDPSPNYEGYVWAKNKHVRALEFVPMRNAPAVRMSWLDVLEQRLVLSDPVFFSNLAPWTYDRFVLYSPPIKPARLELLSLTTGHLLRLASSGCSSYRSLGFTEDRVAYSCLGPSGGARWTEVIDLSRALRWRLPPVLAFWIQPEPLRIVGIRENGEIDTLLSWTLTSVVEPASQ